MSNQVPKTTINPYLKSIVAQRMSISSTETNASKRAKLDIAEQLASRLNAEATYLTADHQSWYILKRDYLPSTEESRLNEWSLHPETRHVIKVYGKAFEEKRWSQAWGIPLSYSGATSPARPLVDSPFVQELVDRANEATLGLYNVENAYNACLQNWYEPEDSIGLHADDEREMRDGYPIFSLSWGGPRRFLLRSKSNKDIVEIFLRDGDLLVMGGTCQKTHKHEVPKLRKTMDPPTTRRINYTIRAICKEY